MSRPGYGGIAALGDLVQALEGLNVGYKAATYAISPSTTTIDCSLASDFYFKMPATSVVKIGNPTNYGSSSEVNIHVLGITSFGTIVWGTLYQTTGAFATFSTGKVKSIGFRYVPGLAKFTEVYRTTSK